MENIATQETIESRKYQRRWWTLAVINVSLILIAIDITILNVAIPTLQRELDASASALQWIASSYVLVFAGLLLTMGFLGDRFGRRLSLQAGLAVFVLASLGAAYAQSSAQLIIARSAMGVGAAMIMPATLSIIIDVFPKGERAKAIGIWAAAAGMGAPLGMVAGGWLLDNFWWGSVFLINIPVGLLTLTGSLFLVPESRDPAPHKLDIAGAVLSTAALSTLIYAIIEAPERGWFAPIVVGAFAASLVLGVVFTVYELRSSHPMLDVRLFRNPRLTSSAVAISASFLGLLGMMFTITQYFQFVQGYSPLDTGIRLVPLALGFMVGAGTSDKLVAAFGTKRIVGGGLAVVAVALVSLAFADVGTAYWIIGLGLFVMGAGMGNTMAPATDALVGAVPEANAGVGSALNDVTRNVGGALGIGIMGSVLNSIYGSNITAATSTLPTGAAAAAQNSIGAAAQVASGLEAATADILLAAANNAFVDAFGIAMFVGAAFAALGAMVVFQFMPAREVAGNPVITLQGVGEGVPSDYAPIPVPVRIDD